jgi:hypothetical protein
MACKAAIPREEMARFMERCWAGGSLRSLMSGRVRDGRRRE